MAESALSIRPAQESDAASILEVYEPYVRETAVSFEVDPPTVDVMAKRIAGNIITHPWLVAERQGRVIGYAYAFPHSQRPGYRWTVDVTIYTHNEQRRTGIGRALYNVLIESLRHQGFRSAFAEIVLPHPGSIRLHESFGFALIGVHKDIGFKLGSWRDIGYWRMALSDEVCAPAEPIPFATFQETILFRNLLF